MSKKPNIVQLTNDYIDNANQEQRLERAEHEQRNRFMGWILFVVVLLFILPTYNLVETYMNIKQQEKEVLSLQKDYEKLSTQTKERKDLAKKLKDDAFAEKYARAKYYYSREGESIYPVPRTQNRYTKESRGEEAGMKKLLIAVTVVLVSSSPLILLPMEKELTLTSKQVQKLTQNTTVSLSQFKQIPKNPRTVTSILTYKNKELTDFKANIQADTKLSISAIFWNAKGEPVFQLQDGDYVAASQQSIIDDSVYNQKPVDMTFWTKDGLSVYKEPYVLGTEKADSKLASFKPIKVSRAAQTHAGTYYLVDGEGWINASDLSTTDNRIDAVQKVLNEKYNNQERISVYVKQLDTGKIAAINDEKSMYAASVAKLGVLYYAQERLSHKKLSLSDEYQYTSAVNGFPGAYDPDGSGKISKMPDDKNYSLENLLKAVAQNSDNVATNILGYYVANQYDKAFQKSVDKAAATSWNMDKKELTARAAGTLMEAVYRQNGDIINYLSSTDYDGERISKNIDVPVAHKIGDAYDFKHDVAIVYADSPFILSIFTDKEGYDKITSIADDVYGILR